MHDEQLKLHADVRYIDVRYCQRKRTKQLDVLRSSNRFNECRLPRETAHTLRHLGFDGANMGRSVRDRLDRLGV